MFFQPKRFISAGTVSFLYFSCIRLIMPFSFLPNLYLPNFYLSNVVPQRLQARTRLPSARVLWPMRVCLPQLPQTTWTFEACMGPSFSTMPPLMFFAGFGLV